MPKICLSYRRADSMAIVGRIFDRLADHCGAETVFMDIENIPFGTNFRNHIDNVLKDCALLIAVVGPQWVAPRPDGAPRIYERTDPVRMEIQTALRRGILIVPVLVEGAKMPTKSELPRSLKQFALLNAVEVDSGRDFNVHMERLIRAAQESIADDADMSGQTASMSLSSVEAEHPKVAGVERERVRLLGSFLGYLLIPTFLLVLAHYLIIVRFDLNSLFLRSVTIAVPLAAGFVFIKNSRQGLGFAMLLDICMGLITVFCMLLMVSIVDETPIVPTTMLDWQEALEYFITIMVAALAGNAMARLQQKQVVRSASIDSKAASSDRHPPEP